MARRPHLGDIDAEGILRRDISKTRKTTKAAAVHAVADYPMVKKVPERTPAEKRIGPLVICNLTGLPPTDARCRRFFPQGRHPDAVWNMDACAGANTEADVAGATIEERMAMSMHTTMENSERCLRKLEPALHRAAAKRTAYRMRPSGTEDGE